MVSLVIDNGGSPAVNDQRLSLIKIVHVARKSLHMHDDDYRALLERVTGYRSVKNCYRNELLKVIDEFTRLGFEPKGSASRRTPANGVVARKARAMWISLYQLGAIDDPSERALEAFGRRQLGVERLQWADERQGFKLIEALKAIAWRAGWDQRVPSRMPTPERIRLLKDRLVAAQLSRLAELGVTVTGKVTEAREGWSNKRLESAAADLAARLRDVTPPT
jgi:hypothetical protein